MGAASANEQHRPEEACQQKRQQIHHQHEARRPQVVGGLDFRVHAHPAGGGLDLHSNGKASFVVHSQRHELTRRVSADGSGASRHRIAQAVERPDGDIGMHV